MASIQAMLSTSPGATPAPAPSHLADAQDGDFHALLASHVAAAQPTHIVVPRETHADKPGKVIDHVRPADRDTKVSRKEARAEEKSAKKSDSKTDASSDAQTDLPVQPAPAATPVRAVAFAQGIADEDTDAEDTNVVDQVGVQLAAAPKAGNSQPAKAAPTPKPIPDANVPADPQAKATREPRASAAVQTTPAKEVSQQAMDKIVALAKSDAQQPVSNTAVSTTNTAAQPAPRVVQTLAANVTAMLNAVRGTMTVSSPKQVPAMSSDAKPDGVADKAAQPIVTAQAQATGKSAQNAQSTARETSRDQDRPVPDDVAKADVAIPEQTAVAPATATSAQQPAAPAAQIAAVATPNAVNAAAPAQANAAPHQTSSAPHSDPQPNIPSLAAAIAAKSAAGTKTFDIRMDPPELGRVDVHLSVDRDGKVQAILSAEHPQTLELLQKDSHNLERALKDAGLDLSNNSLNFSLKGEGRQGDGGGASMARARSLPDAVVARAEAANASASHFNHASGDGRLDIRV